MKKLNLIILIALSLFIIIGCSKPEHNVKIRYTIEKAPKNTEYKITKNGKTTIYLTTDANLHNFEESSSIEENEKINLKLECNSYFCSISIYSEDYIAIYKKSKSVAFIKQRFK